MAADDIMEGFQIWGNEFKDYLPMSRHPCNPRGLEIGSPIIVAIITSPRAISVGSAILSWQSRRKQATSITRRQQCHHSQYIYICAEVSWEVGTLARWDSEAKAEG